MLQATCPAEKEAYDLGPLRVQGLEVKGLDLFRFGFVLSVLFLVGVVARWLGLTALWFQGFCGLLGLGFSQFCGFGC